MLLMMMLTTVTAWANDAVTYIDMNGKTQTVTEYTEVTTDMTADGNGNIRWSDGTYVVKNDVTLNGRIEVDYLDLIVCNDATLTVNGSDDSAFTSITINIYAQSKGTGAVNTKKNISCNNLNIAGGKVTLDAADASCGLYIFSGDNPGLTVNGGDVTILNNDQSQSTIYFDNNGSVTLNGGKLTVTNNAANWCEAIEGSGDNIINFNGGTAEINGCICDIGYINLNGGNVTVNGEVGSYWYYTVTYDFTRTTDSYYIQSFFYDPEEGMSGTVQVAEGNTFLCNGKSYSGKLDFSQISAISGKTMTPDVSAHFSKDNDDSYTIHTATGWDIFCDALQDNDTYNRFSGKTVYLGANIGTAQNPITRMAGTSKHDFCGTFDGQGNTLTVNISSDKDHDYTAPFSYISVAKANPSDENDSPAAIRNLNVAGTVTATKDYAGGIVGAFWGTLTIENCTSSVAINTNNKHAAGFISNARGNVTITNCLSSGTITGTISGDGTHAGFIGGSASGVITNITGCAFTGSLLGDSTTHCAGFVGYNSGTLTITNSLFAPDSVSVGDTGSATFARGNAPTLNNSYYTDSLGTAQGKVPRNITGGANVTIDSDNISGSGGFTRYNVSGIVAYTDCGGLSRGDNYYFGGGDCFRVWPTNSCTDAPLGYRYSYDFGNCTDIKEYSDYGLYVITMPDEDVTVNVVLAPIDWAKESTGDDADHAYMIYNKDQLLLLAYRVNGTHGETANYYKNKYFKLGANIKFSHPANEGKTIYDENYEAIGGYHNNISNEFMGNFDGADYTVSGIRIRKTGIGADNDCLGLFGNISGANIHHVHVTDARIYGYDYVGGIVGKSYGSTISNCTITESDITATCGYEYILKGTICGTNSSGTLINNYYRHCTVNGKAVSSGVGCEGVDITANDGAMPMYVAYIDENGDAQKCFDYKELTGGEAAKLSAGWYVAQGKVNYTGTITLGGDVNIILADSCTLNIGTEDERLNNAKCIVAGDYGLNYNLTIYGQTNHTGALNAYSNQRRAVDVKNYTQHGGTVTIDAYDFTALNLNGDFTLTRGTLNAKATGQYSVAIFVCMSENTATVSGGTLNAISTDDDAICSTLVLSGTATVTATGGIDGKVTIADGQIFTDGTNFYTGTLTADEKTAINGQTLTRLTALQLADNASNATAIEKLNGVEDIDVALTGRTLYKDGDWNTLVLPFDVVLKESVLDGDEVKAMVLDGDNSDLNDGTLTLNFVDAPATIPAGTPFIIKWESGDNLQNPVFSAVTIDNTNRDVDFTGGSFKGTYQNISFTQEDKSILFLGTQSKLHWPLAGAYLNACRAYFQLTDPAAGVREFKLNFDGEETTGVISTTDYTDSTDKASAIYDLQGRKVENPKKGLYIHGGRKIIVK